MLADNPAPRPYSSSPPGVRELAAAAKVSVDTVARFERGEELKERLLICFSAHWKQPELLIEENGGGPGVRLRKRQQKKAK